MRDILIAVLAFIAGSAATMGLGAVLASDLRRPQDRALRSEARRNRERVRGRLRVIRGTAPRSPASIAPWPDTPSRPAC